MPRLLLVQCNRCGCNGSGKVNRTHRLISTNIASTRNRYGLFTHTCGGTLVAYDIEVGE